MNPYLTHSNPRTQELLNQVVQLPDDDARIAWMTALSEDDRALMRAWAKDCEERLLAAWHTISQALELAQKTLLDWAKANQELFAAFADKDRNT
jgi:hypothetical protein